MSEWNDRIDAVHAQYDHYRNAGLTVTALIITLSGGAIVGLFNNQETKARSFLFILPILVSLSHQLVHYFGSKFKARANFNFLHSSITGQRVPAISDAAEINKEYSDFLFGLGDQLCLISFLAFLSACFYIVHSLASNSGVQLYVYVAVVPILYVAIRFLRFKSNLKGRYPNVKA